MNLEPITQNEVSQKEKNKHCILTHMCVCVYIYVCVCVCVYIYIYISVCVYMESRKMVLMNLFAGEQWRHRHGKQAYGQGCRGGRRG